MSHLPSAILPGELNVLSAWSKRHVRVIRQKASHDLLADARHGIVPCTGLVAEGLVLTVMQDTVRRTWVGRMSVDLSGNP